MKSLEKKEKKYKNKYFKSSKISERKIRELVRYFAQDLTCVQISNLMKIDRKVVNRYVNKIIEKIAYYCQKVSTFDGKIELDESYFGGRYKHDKRGRGAPKKVPVRVK